MFRYQVGYTFTTSNNHLHLSSSIPPSDSNNPYGKNLNQTSSNLFHRDFLNMVRFTILLCPSGVTHYQMSNVTSHPADAHQDGEKLLENVANKDSCCVN
jgi:hypothetical protein